MSALSLKADIGCFEAGARALSLIQNNSGLAQRLATRLVANSACCRTDGHLVAPPRGEFANDLAKVRHSGAGVDAIARRWRVLPNSSQGPSCETAEFWSALRGHKRAGFSKRGYVVGSSLLFERRGAEAHPDRLPGLVDELKTKAELIMTNAYAAARVLKDRANVPVVAITGADPVATGLIDSLARPGGTITGVG